MDGCMNGWMDRQTDMNYVFVQRAASGHAARSARRAVLLGNGLGGAAVDREGVPGVYYHYYYYLQQYYDIIININIYIMIITIITIVITIIIIISSSSSSSSSTSRGRAWRRAACFRAYTQFAF